MKIKNLPSKKISVLVLMAWVSANRVEAGKAFENCLTANGDTTSYDSLLTFPYLSKDLDIFNKA